MGSHRNISQKNFPRQKSELGLRAEVLFNHDSTRPLYGTIVRADIEEPGVTIIKLSDGRYVLGTECQYASLPRT
jgi:hypothetical protein